MDRDDGARGESADKERPPTGGWRRALSRRTMATSLASIERVSHRIVRRLSSGSARREATEDDLVPREMVHFTIEHSENCLTEFFSRVGRDLVIHGQMLLIGKDMLVADIALAYHCGVMLAPGLLLLYASRIDGSAITFTYLTGLSLLNAAVSLEHNIIIIKSKTESHIKIQDNTKIQEWYDKLSKCCEAGQTDETPSPVKPRKNKLRSASIDEFASKMKSQMKSIRKKYIVPVVISDITTSSWYTDDNFLSNHGTRNAQFSTLSEENAAIDDDTFFLISRVWGRVSKTEDELSECIFTKMLVSLNKYCFYLLNHKNQLKIDMGKFDLTSTERMKWSIRIGCDGFKVDIKLDSKENYEIWSLAFLKMFRRNEESLSKNEKEQKETLSSCLPIPLPLECESQTSRFTFVSVVNEEASVCSNDQPNDDFIRRSIYDDVFVSNSCYRKRISEYSAVHSSKNHRNSEICDCTFSTEFEEDDIQIPLPIRCEKRTIAQKFKKSCHILAHFVPKPYDLKRAEIFNSKRTKSELDLSIKSPKLFTKNINPKRNLCGDSSGVSRITKSYNDLRLETIIKEENEENIRKNKPKIPNPNIDSDEDIYEEPISSKDRNKSP